MADLETITEYNFASKKYGTWHQGAECETYVLNFPFDWDTVTIKMVVRPFSGSENITEVLKSYGTNPKIEIVSHTTDTLTWRIKPRLLGNNGTDLFYINKTREYVYDVMFTFVDGGENITRFWNKGKIPIEFANTEAD